LSAKISNSEGLNPLFDGFDRDILAGSTCSYDDLKKELDHWFFWMDKFSPEGTHDQYYYFYEFEDSDEYLEDAK